MILVNPVIDLTSTENVANNIYVVSKDDQSDKTSTLGADIIRNNNVKSVASNASHTVFEDKCDNIVKTDRNINLQSDVPLDLSNKRKPIDNSVKHEWSCDITSKKKTPLTTLSENNLNIDKGIL